ncbi:MAG: hypothetical protein IT440_02050 [Phycisphaeraceae bacterium]|nr:hypothetical protein [Phycisphaeraceae bacterium]
MTTPTSRRFALLKAIARQRHRYSLLRAVSQTFSLAVLAVVPLTGLARVDFWGGEHRLLFHPAPFKHALGGVVIGIGAMYVVTFLSNVAAGRLFCGWGCPVGQISRFGDAVDVPGQSLLHRALQHVKGAAFSGAFILSMLAWWTDLRVLVMGNAIALGLAWGSLACGVIAAYLHGRWWRWEFCKSLCPIGLYYSFVAPARYFGVHFRNQHETCIECNGCDNVCPVNLTPRDLMKPVTDRVGVSIADAPGHNHCLECGDCIKVCEFMVGKKGLSPIPLKLGHFAGPQRITPSSPASPVDASESPLPTR